MKVALDEVYLPFAKPALAEHEIIPFSSSDPGMADLATAVSVFAPARAIAFRGRPPVLVDLALVGSLPEVQLVHKGGSGIDRFDLEALSAHGILLSTNKGTNASSVAEHIILLTLLCLRNSYWDLANMRQGNWGGTPDIERIRQIEGKSVGIIGLGEIGLQVAKRFLAFGTNVLAYQRRPLPEPAMQVGVKWTPFDELLGESDIVTLCVPLTKQTGRLIGARELGLMKRTAVLINCARGGVVDERSLYAALAEGRLLAAGLDVFEQEPASADNPLLKLKNVFATPHLAGRSSEVTRREIEATLHNLRLFLDGQLPMRLENPEILRLGTARAKHLIR